MLENSDSQAKLLATFDLAPQTGMGHYARSIALLKQIQSLGLAIDIALSEQQNKYLSTLKITLPEGINTIEYHDAFSQIHDYDLLLIDSYKWHSEDTARLRQYYPGLRIIRFIDYGESDPFCDLIVDTSNALKAFKQTAEKNTDPIILSGLRYACMNAGFDKVKETKRCLNILVLSFGSMDTYHWIKTAIEAGDFSGFDRVYIPLSSQAPHFSEIYKAINDQDSSNIELIADADMQALFRQARYYFGALGGTAWEAVASGLECGFVSIVDNQDENLNFLKSLHYPFVWHRDDVDMRKAINEFSLSNQHSEALKSPIYEICDGLGSLRVAMAIVGNFIGFTARPVTDADKAKILEWQKQPGARKYANNPSVPSQEEHENWFHSLIPEDRSRFYIIEVANDSIGFVRADTEESGFRVSILFDRVAQGTGAALFALSYIKQKFEGQLFAEVHEDNIASQKLFRLAGFEQQKSDRFVG